MATKCGCSIRHRPLFTEVPRRGVLGSSDSGSCIERPPRATRMASEAHHVEWRGSTCCGGA